MKTSPVSTAIAALLGLFFASPPSRRQSVQPGRAGIAMENINKFPAVSMTPTVPVAWSYTRTGHCAAAPRCKRSKIAAT